MPLCKWTTYSYCYLFTLTFGYFLDFIFSRLFLKIIFKSIQTEHTFPSHQSLIFIHAITYPTSSAIYSELDILGVCFACQYSK